MRTLSSADLLDAWESGLGRGAAERAVVLLRLAAEGAAPGGDPGHWPLGERDARLLDLRESAFGPRLEGVATCPQCGAEQEFHVSAGELRAAGPPDTAEMSVALGNYRAQFRLPDSIDLCELEASASGERDISLQLLERCVIGATVGERSIAAADLPNEVVRQISERMSQADPQADIDLAMQCPACSHRWSELFDIASFLSIELNAWARRTLSEVHQLAAAYGWSESEVLSMSSTRRGFYLEMIAS